MMTKHDPFEELDDDKKPKGQSIKQMMLENDHYAPKKHSKLSFVIFIITLLIIIFIVGMFII
ncbi:hypothetical protein ISO99_05055 [Staphylococcus sp. 18_1_E_LY]|uniref:2-isopropylmalate synthase n=1 Tax=Staphylococcus lloydii TaxID=2781774 RepID=A0A7T1F9H3_9STAP|nr:hypothetical protein [Staphylococcus lloydii]MBF7019275.1 hypothetical protein [Staphylococcus lloydii]MBF7027003.1 hypothetical protein [Staphylococcus lloydii]QPM74650.1 hypothetical protein ISP08_09915 [Staphylococcus lloydii]